MRGKLARGCKWSRGPHLAIPDKVHVHSGCKDTEEGQVLKQLFHRPHFRVAVVSDVATVELCGALKVQLSVMSCVTFMCVYMYVLCRYMYM